MKAQLYRIVCLWVLLCTLSSTPLRLLTPPVYAETTATTDTPTQRIDERLNVWALNQGVIYWGLNCSGGNEFRESGFLKRIPVNGNSTVFIANIPADKCATFRNLTVDSEGAYYYNEDEARIERHPSSAPYDPAIPLHSTNSAPVATIPLVTDQDFVYWATPANQIVRVGKDGTGFATVANTASGLGDFSLLNGTLYWLDSQGLMFASTTCANLPCPKNQRLAFDATGDHSLIFRQLTLLNYAFDYVRTGSSDSIHRITCALSIAPGGGVSCTDSTLYTVPTPDWTIGDLVSDGKKLYWTETQIDNFGQSVDGHLRAKPLSGGTAVNLVDNAADLSSQLALADDQLYFARFAPANVGLWQIATAATALVYDFKADGFEVTQAVQNLANDVPLAANKATFVRVYGTELSGPNANAVQVHLIGKRNGQPLPDSPLLPINNARSLQSGGAYNRAKLNDSWNFLLPDHWTNQGLIELSAVVDPSFNYDDSNRTNNTVSKGVIFQYQPPVCVMAPPVRTNTPLPTTHDTNFTEMVQRFARLWPVTDAWVYKQSEPLEELEFCVEELIGIPCYGAYELDDESLISDNDRLMGDLIARFILTDFPDECDPVGAPKHLMGMVHPDADTTKSTGTTTGFANFIFEASWVKSPPHTPNPFPAGWSEMDAATTMAQELTHNYDRGHVNCGSPSQIDTNYPYPGCQLSDVGATNYYGFDLATKTPITPTQASDFMSYSPDAGQAPDWQGQWVSDYTWRGLFQGMAAAAIAQSATSGVQSTAAQSTGSMVYIAGVVEENSQQAELGYAYVLPNAALSASMRSRLAQLRSETVGIAAHYAHHADHGDAPHAHYHLRLLDAANTLLGDVPVTLLPADDHDATKAVAQLAASFPAPEGVVAKVEFMADATLLDSISVGSAVPTVAIQQPVGGALLADEVLVQWTASDPDPTDSLLFTIQYSYDDGGHWQSLVNNYPSNLTGAYALTLTDATALPGSNGQHALMRVIASDGYHTTIATSQPFAVTNRAPEPFITLPTPEQGFAADAAVGLHGGANDVEDGGLTGSALQWQVDGVSVGNGRDLEVTGLAPGAHLVALHATDTANATAIATTTLQMATLTIPQVTAPTLDGSCEDSGYTNGVALNLKPYGNGAQATVHLVRSTDALWACFTGLKLQGGVNPSAFAGLRIDVNNSRDGVAQPSDFGIFAGENGDLFTRIGDGSGGFTANGPAMAQSQIAQSATGWNAELQIDAAALGGWQHLASIAAGHYGVANATDEYQWPYAAVTNQPNTWAVSAFGDVALLTSLEPVSATVGSAAFTLAIEGSGFISGTKAMWGGVELPTVVVDSQHLAVQIGAEQLTSAGKLAVTAKTSTPFVSNPLSFTIVNAPPALMTLTPASVLAESTGVVLSVTGSNFGAGATMLWNGKPLPTIVVNSTQLTTPLTADLLAQSRTVGIAVLNPDGQVTHDLPFVIQPASQQPPSQRLYLPLITR